MKYEEIENVWAVQHASGDGAPPDLREHLRREFQGRRRLLVFLVGAIVLGIFLNQFFFVINTLYASQPLTFLRLMQIVLVEALSIIVLVRLLRRLRSLRQLRRQNGEPVRNVLAAALDYLKVEMTDYRLGHWVVLLSVVLTLVSIYLNNPIPQVGWGPFVLRIGMVATILVPVVLVLSRHYRKNLVPEFHRLQQNLEQLGG